MLLLNDVSKSYTTANFTQRALDGVTVAFRDNEFAAVLGPSGSGKTTMLNIIGGLDHYDAGDLVIDGISTKEYTDRDWDIYRNNRIGFVFQSYNLIPHQTVLANVELALTLSGVSKEERRARATEALTRVGLADHINKRPNQLSGGQMQRVAIARALINDPEIVLADEPTGALDTETSVQVMNLLTDIAKDRLVIMVTHNPELAEQYANRTIHLRDGRIISDSRPYDPYAEGGRVGRQAQKASMSFATALSLSFSNLMTKKARTFTTALAGSIGIIGIALILALANGINAYIRNIEEETLSMYPLTIQSQGLDLAAMLGGPIGGNEGSAESVPGMVAEQRIVQTMFSLRNNNDLRALKEYFAANPDLIDPYVNDIHYTYNITPQIYLANTDSSVEQVNPDAILASFGMGSSTGFAAMLGGGGMGMSAFHEMPGELSMFAGQYDVLAGNWPEQPDEMVLVLSQGGRISDFELFAMGLNDRNDLRAMLDTLMNNLDDTVVVSEAGGLFSYDDLMATQFKLVNPVDRFEYDDTFNVWVDRSNDSEFMRNLLARSQTLTISGIVQPRTDVIATTLSSGLNYRSDLVQGLIDQAAASPLVLEQQANPTINVLTGISFAAEQAQENTGFDFSRLITVDEEAMQEVFQFDQAALDTSALEIDAEVFELDPALFELDMGTLDPSTMSLDFSAIDIPPFDPGDMSGLIISLAEMMRIPPQQIAAIMAQVMDNFIADQVAHSQPGEPLDPSTLSTRFNEYIARPEVQTFIATQLTAAQDPTHIQEQATAEIQTYLQAAIQTYLAQVMATMQTQIEAQVAAMMQQVTIQAQTSMATAAAQMQTAMQTAMGEVSEQMSQAMEQMSAQMAAQMDAIDPATLAGVFRVQMDENEIFDLMNSMMTTEEGSATRNLNLFGYADRNTPAQIDIYPRDFESKDRVIQILDDYNAQMTAQGTPERVVRYTDFIGVMMSSVTDIINMVTVALVAFVAISLVVSSIMIGVITYISVLERKKEIGILRAIGASKLNIREVFNAETLIVGFVAGLLGVLVSVVISLIASAIIWNRFQIPNIAQLPIWAALALIAISMLLTFIAGLIPSNKAAKNDPVESLRSE